MGAIDLIFTGPPGPEGCEFVEIQDDQGRSIKIGEWAPHPQVEGQVPDGWWRLRIENLDS